MFLLHVDPEHRLLFLRALRSAAAADGAVAAREQAFLEIAREALTLDVGLEGLEPLHAEDPALDALDGTARERVVQAMILMSILDGRGAREEADLVEAFARRLQVRDTRVANLRQLAEGRVAYMRYDLTRKGYARDELVRTARDEGLGGVYRTFGPLLGLARDPELARRYIALGEKPPGTVGRAYFDLITSNDLSFPGEAGGLAERGMWHDMIHVIGDYPTDPVGEAEVVAFMAGFRHEDPFFWLFTVALQFQVGLVISPFAPGVPDRIEPRRFVLHHKRGALVNADLTTAWRFEEEWDAPLEAVRTRFNVVPVASVSL